MNQINASKNTSTTALPRRRLGAQGPEVSTIGLGCMGMSAFYGIRDEARSTRTLLHALDSGIDFLDTADVYGPFTNEELVGKSIAGRRNDVFLATKCGIVRDPADPSKRGVDNRPEYIKACCEASLKRLGTDHIDLYYLHRHNPDSASIEEAVGAMGDLVKAGKIRYIGLSEVNANTLERAHSVHPITAVQSEYSLWTRDPEKNGVLGTCRRLGIGFVPFSPIGRGFLSGTIRRFEDFPEHDSRRNLPRFQSENFQKNLDLVTTLENLAQKRGATAVQLALAWVLAQAEFIVPIPGTTRIEHLDELIAGAKLSLTESELSEINAAFPFGAAAGNRSYPDMQAFLER